MIPFLLAVHSHQPVGNFERVFDDALEGCYQPFLEELSEHPGIKVSLHYSGCLLEWMEDRAPDHVDFLKELVDSGQVEILTGAYYEPVFTAVPDRDLRAQISSYTDRLEALFGKRPKGIWLTERVWDPQVASVLHDLGIEFTMVDDSHFRYAGVPGERAWGPWLTEREGKSIVILPIDKTLRYYIPFREPDQSMEYVARRAEESPGFAACYGDDGEKFGVWPGTREWVYGKGWLARFFEALEKNEHGIRTVHISEYLAEHAPRGRVYIPPASYQEMMEWALPPELGRRLEDFTQELAEAGRWEELSPFVRGGHFDMFLSKYREANLMHKRMLLASERLSRRPRAPEEARKTLYRSQCNCAYWHGVFGGIYLGHLRHEVYRQILASEAMAVKSKGLRIERRDYDLDGHEELIISSPRINAFISARDGGAMQVIEYPPKRFNLSNVMSRREETYHRKLVEQASRQGGEAPATIHEITAAKEEGLDKHLVYDRFPRYSVQEHLVPPDLGLEEIEREETVELGRFAGAPYEPLSAGEGSVVLAREDRCGEAPLRIEKEYVFENKRSGFDVNYRLRLLDDKAVSIRFAVEWNLTLLGGDSEGRHCLVDGERPEDSLMNGRGEHKNASLVELVNQDDGFKVVIGCAEPGHVFRYPVECVSLSESGFERTYQGSCMWFTWPVGLSGGDELALSLSFDLEDIPESS